MPIYLSDKPGPVFGAEGILPFYMKHQPWMDAYTGLDEPSAWAFYNDKYDHMQVYHSYWQLQQRSEKYSKGFVYKDAMALKPEWQVTIDNPDWIMTDPVLNVVPMYIDFLDGGVRTQYAADIFNPAFRSWWLGELATWTNEANYQGVWVDDVNMDLRISTADGTRLWPYSPYLGRVVTVDDWRAAMAGFMAEIRGFIDLFVSNFQIVHNAIWYAADSLTDPNIRTCIENSNYFNLERGVSDAGLRGPDGDVRFQLRTLWALSDYCHSLGTGMLWMNYGVQTNPLTETDVLDYEIANFLLVTDGSDLFSQGNSSSSDAWAGPEITYSDAITLEDGVTPLTTEGDVPITTEAGTTGATGVWYTAYDVGLGRSTTDRYLWNDLWRRDFELGSVLLNEPEEANKTGTLDGTPYDLDASKGVVIVA